MTQTFAARSYQVKPYYFDFVANVKQRWWGMTLVDLFAKASTLSLSPARLMHHTYIMIDAPWWWAAVRY